MDFDPSAIRSRKRVLNINNVINRIRCNEIDMQPDFQRRANIWNNVAQSHLIESILISIPLPSFYFDSSDDDKWLTIDGLQRLTTLKRFIIDEDLKLEGLEFLTELEGKTFSNLPRKYQRDIDEYEISAYLLEEGTPSNVKFIVFRRINTGGLPLSPQEIRNTLYTGPVTRFLEKLSKNCDFTRVMGDSLKSKQRRMEDQEFVLRFLAFFITSHNEYRGNLDSFLNDGMEKINHYSENEYKELENSFVKAMKAAYKIFQERAFRKPKKKGKPKTPLNKGLFESWSVNLAKLNDEQLEKIIKHQSSEVNRGFKELMRPNSELEKAVSTGTGSVNKVKTRFNLIAELLKDVLERYR